MELALPTRIVIPKGVLTTLITDWKDPMEELSGGGVQTRLTQVDFPKFNGDDPKKNLGINGLQIVRR